MIHDYHLPFPPPSVARATCFPDTLRTVKSSSTNPRVRPEKKNQNQKWDIMFAIPKLQYRKQRNR